MLLLEDERLDYFDPGQLTSNDTANATVTICQRLLLEHVGDESVKIWDLAILVPNLLFLVCLIWQFKRLKKAVKDECRNGLLLFIMVLGGTMVSVTRSVLAMSLHAHASNTAGFVEKSLWVLLKFFLVAAEIIVITYCCTYGRYDMRASTKPVLIITVIVSILYSVVQGLLELKYSPSSDPFSGRDGHGDLFDLFSHGGMKFLVATSAMFALVYIFVCLLSLARNRLRLPVSSGRVSVSRSFHVYCCIMFLLNLAQVAGGSLILTAHPYGMCVIDVASFLYFAFFTILVYAFFLVGYLTRPEKMFREMVSYGGDGPDDGELPPSAMVYGGFPGMISDTSDEFLAQLSSEIDYSRTSKNPLHQLVLDDVSVGTVSTSQEDDLAVLYKDRSTGYNNASNGGQRNELT